MVQVTLFIVSIIELCYGGGEGTCTPISKTTTKAPTHVSFNLIFASGDF